VKAIKCPNCGNKMKAMSAPCKVTILAVDAQWRCPSCNVCGPSCREKNAHLAIRSAARLTREWIARMEADGLCVAGNNRINEVVDKFESSQPTEKHITVRRVRVGIPGNPATTETYLEVTP
jgi:hypothetical protein